jgi:phosphate transport system permease protein
VTSQPITGRRRRRTTTRSVKVAERLSRTLITAGGFGTIVAVIGILAFLLSVVVPLFSEAEVGTAVVHELGAGADLLAAGIDDNLLLAWTLDAEGRVSLFRLSDGELLDEQRPFGDELPTASYSPATGSEYAFGFADGSVRGATIEIVPNFPGEEAAFADLPVGETVAQEGALLERTPTGQLRRLTLSFELDDPVRVGTEAPVRLVARASLGRRSLLAAYKQDRTLELLSVRTRRNILTGEVTTTSERANLPEVHRAGQGEPAHLQLSPVGDSLALAWDDGHLTRFDTRDFEATTVAEEVSLVRDKGARLSTLAFLAGGGTLVSGDSAGNLAGWFRIRDEAAEQTADGRRLVAAHHLEAGASPVTALAVSARDRRFAAGYADGRVRLFHMTSKQLLAELDTGSGLPVDRLALAPRNDGLLAFTSGGAWLWAIEAEHPETNLATLFTPVWYESAPRPKHVWQSSGGTDDFEPKLGLWPLVFGTLKATFYSLFFSVPIALLAAIYTSEFLPKSVAARVKQLIEMMASLPSVVLGFLAALVLAPFVEGVVPAVLLSFLVVPAVLLTGAFLWQLLPQAVAVRAAGWPRLLAVVATLPIAVWATAALGPVFERAAFGGDVRAWLDGQTGSGYGGWLVLGLPAAVLATALLLNLVVNPWLRRISGSWSRLQAGIVDLLKYVLALLFTIGACMALARGLDLAGLDPRGGFLDTYVQRNALIVGFVMGFAVIPIIYTLAEDALSAVPDHLRAASLASGATRWQTAVRVIMPTAMSGMFSAVMIGLGRAVGETMVVLMAAGNTPVMDLNIFNGFRTLSATIAVELPEAVRDSTLYRVLFLSALTLFAMTFVINTVAEVIRLRFRKRAYEL